MPPTSTVSKAVFLFLGFVWFSVQKEIISLNSNKQLIFVKVKGYVFFEVRTEVLKRSDELWIKG